MKLATLNDGSRDGQLVVVSRDLTRYTDASFLVPTLQAALDNWSRVAPHLAAMAESIETGAVPTLRFHEHDAHSPLPRAYQFIVGSAVSNDEKPRLRQAGSGAFLGPRDPVLVSSEDLEIDFEGGVAVIIDDVAMGASVAEAGEAIRLVMLANELSLRALMAEGPEKAGDYYRSKPSSAFSPVAVSPEELGDAWDGGRVDLPLCVDLNGKQFGRANSGAVMAFDFPQLIAEAATTRPLVAGTIIGSGFASSRNESGSAGPVAAGGTGYSSIADQRGLQAAGEDGEAKSYLRFGDTLRIEMKDKAGHSIFGAIEQVVQAVAD